MAIAIPISIPAKVFDLITVESAWPRFIHDVKFDEGFDTEAEEVRLHAVVLFKDNQGYYPMAIYKDTGSSRVFFVNEEDKENGFYTFSSSFFDLYRMSRNPALFDQVIYYNVYGIKLFTRIFDNLLVK